MLVVPLQSPCLGHVSHHNAAFPEARDARPRLAANEVSSPSHSPVSGPFQRVGFRLRISLSERGGQAGIQGAGHRPIYSCTGASLEASRSPPSSSPAGTLSSSCTLAGALTVCSHDTRPSPTQPHRGCDGPHGTLKAGPVDLGMTPLTTATHTLREDP